MDNATGEGANQVRQILPGPVFVLAVTAFATSVFLCHPGTCDGEPGQQFLIVCPAEASALETLAAREIQRYIYLRTDALLPIVRDAQRGVEGKNAIVVGRAARGFVTLPPAPGTFLLKTIFDGHDRRKLVLAFGGDDVSTLYAAYRFAEHLGMRFYLHGDVAPDRRIALELPDLDEKAEPLFNLRGIQPFHDFPEGPDWWNLDDYKAIISQLPKLRMNFLALHTYPEGHPNAEPTVWIGLPNDVRQHGHVESSYPASYQNTLRGNWGYSAKKTSDFIFGASRLFEHDAHGADVMLGMCPQPESPDDCNEVFRRTGEVLGQAFRYAHLLGVKTCVGTETPLTVPKRVQERFKEMGKSPSDPGVIQKLYEGIFLRAAKTYPLDYYWFWTPEGWTWQGASEAQVQKTVADLRLACEAAKNIGAPFQLATCGWVLGPQGDRALFDRVLPKSMPVSCINRQVGKEPVDPAFADVKGRGKWAIPWFEDDPALTSAQLWAGRMRRDAADALQYGCTGLMGIHWRTRILGPTVLALAQAAWDQSGWSTTEPGFSGLVGGQVAAFPNNPIAGTDDDALYQTVRYDVSAYRLILPNGTYDVTLKFCEPHYTASGKRVFSVKLEGEKVINGLDIFALGGQNKALDYRFNDIRVADGQLDINFVHDVEFPSIAAISVQGPGISKKINCGGPAYRDYAADPPPPPRDLPTTDFYLDWALHQFGEEVARETAEVFDRLDGALPRSSDWVGGPGGLTPDSRPWEQVKKEYSFVDGLEALRPRVEGAGNRERFDYWLNTFRYMRAASHVRCVWAQYDRTMKEVMAESEQQQRAQRARKLALPLRKQIVRLVGEVYMYLLATVSNTGEMGTVANWDQHILPSLLTEPGQELSRILGEDFPAEAVPSRDYDGPPRLIVPTARTSITEGEALKLKVILLDKKPPRDAAVYCRSMGPGEFTRTPLTHVSRGVYSVTLPPNEATGTAIEYHVKVITTGGESLCFPVTAPKMNQTLVVIPQER